MRNRTRLTLTTTLLAAGLAGMAWVQGVTPVSVNNDGIDKATPATGADGTVESLDKERPATGTAGIFAGIDKAPPATGADGIFDSLDTAPPATGADGIEPVLIPWRMVLVPFESPEQELVMTGTLPAPEGMEDGQEITLVVYHRDAADADSALNRQAELPASLQGEFEDLPSWLRHDIATFGGAGTRLASEVYYMVTGPDYKETGFEIELARPPTVRTGSM